MHVGKDVSLIEWLAEEGALVSYVHEDMISAVGTPLGTINKLRVELATTQKHAQDQKQLLQDEIRHLQLKRCALETSNNDPHTSKWVNITSATRNEPEPPQMVKPMSATPLPVEEDPLKRWEAPVTFHCPSPICPPRDVGFDTSKDVDTPQNDSELSDEGSCSPEPHTRKKEWDNFLAGMFGLHIYISSFTNTAFAHTLAEDASVQEVKHDETFFVKALLYEVAP
ncbi:hypothetical protein BDQ17DRAFT_1332676 [Cyathus striatus]|nr:hypothetical protein BDQ17DRAFT_1332676 [Cyathus striatus]